MIILEIKQIFFSHLNIINNIPKNEMTKNNRQRKTDSASPDRFRGSVFGSSPRARISLCRTRAFVRRIFPAPPAWSRVGSVRVYRARNSPRPAIFSTYVRSRPTGTPAPSVPS